jgi:hypothetical protein
MAQVFSVNAVGYVNTPLVPGFNLVSNPLNNTAPNGNTIANLFGAGIQGTIPNGTTIYWFIPGTGFDLVSYDDLDAAFTPVAKATEVISPGEGVFVRNPSNAALTVTFVGEVPQGTLSHAVPAGFSIQASEVPQEGNAATLAIPGQANDVIYLFDEAVQNYETPRIFDDLDNNWSPPLRNIQVGEAFFYLNRGAADTWTRTFSVNP